MYSAGEKTGANFYVPLASNDNNDDYAPLQPPCKKPRNGTHRTVRVLSRRYALTATGYKFLEIGVNVGPPSYLEIVIGDNRGNELSMSIETWKGLYEQRWNVRDCLRNRCTNVPSSINVGPLTVRFVTINNARMTCLESCDVRMTMTESTLFQMFNLNRCVELTFDRLAGMDGVVDEKFARFSDIASTVTERKDVARVIRDSDYFVENKLIDCELLALMFDTMPQYVKR